MRPCIRTDPGRTFSTTFRRWTGRRRTGWCIPAATEALKHKYKEGIKIIWIIKFPFSYWDKRERDPEKFPLHKTHCWYIKTKDIKSVWCWVLGCWHRDGGNDDGSLTWKSSSQGGWWWCSVASTQVFRNTRVTISQNIHCDLQMLRHCRFIDRFHLGGEVNFTFQFSSVGHGTECQLLRLDTYFSNRFIRFCHGVCLICFRDIFRPSSETLAVTVTEIISN